LQREKALKATSGKFKDVWLVFQGQHGRFFLQAVAPKTAQVSRAEKVPPLSQRRHFRFMYQSLLIY
jgi:hypothetical protein